jgi:hypothetical protein
MRLYELLSDSWRFSDRINYDLTTTTKNVSTLRLVCEVPIGSMVIFKNAYLQPGSGGRWAWLEGELRLQGRIYQIQHYLGFDIEGPNGWNGVRGCFQFGR